MDCPLLAALLFALRNSSSDISTVVFTFLIATHIYGYGNRHDLDTATQKPGLLLCSGSMARIETIGPSKATGELAKVYEELGKSRGKIAEVHKIQSLHPQSIRDHMKLYMTVMFARSPLSRAEREMMAVVVSAGNGCAYCIRHHGEALNHFWKDWSRIEELAARQAAATGLSERERALCVYAQAVAQDPAGAGTESALKDLRGLGLKDRAILDATLVVSYFSSVNRMVLALGVDLEQHAGGYKYA